MRITRPLLITSLLGGLLISAPATKVSEVAITGMISPASVEVLNSAIARATQNRSELIIVRLDTPGGLAEAMRQGISRMISSPIPVITFVAPEGARAASAGFFWLEAGDVAAMAPGTNTGAAHPVIMGSPIDATMKEKLENDAAASLRSIVTRRGRNAALAESAVRQSKSFTENEALEGHLIELIARDEQDLLRLLDGRTVKRFNGSQVTLHTSGAAIDLYDPNLRERILSSISDPNIALILIGLGALLIYAEFAWPGMILPGVVGAILAVLGLGAISALPLNWMSVLLILIGFVLFALEVKYTSHGILSAGGAVALILGLTTLVDSPIPEMRIHLSSAIGVVLPLTAITAFLLALVVKARRHKVVTGAEGMIGMIGTALEELNPVGRVLVRGEYWTAVAPARVIPGTRVAVRGVENLLLRVEPVVGSNLTGIS